jgi:hypothetical protein
MRFTDVSESIYTPWRPEELGWHRVKGPGFEPWSGEIFHTRRNRSRGPPSFLCDGYGVSCTGVKRPGRGTDYPPPSSARVEERVELYLYCPSMPSRPVVELTSPLRTRTPRHTETALFWLKLLIFLIAYHRRETWHYLELASGSKFRCLKSFVTEIILGAHSSVT